jgi:signal transduction histidine kinase
MPAEIVPLVHAVNQAFDRLEAGFRAQRDFTADMAHELRTPLSIMRARVDALEPGPVRDALRTDLVNMTRTVSQVLDIAELESFVIAGDSRADLHAVCAEAVGFMAPLAVDMSKTIALTGVDEPVWVHGHAEALFRAVRNLVDNAIRHTPSGGAIDVDVSADGIVRVADDGPGVPEAERESIFRRFWRRDRTQAESRGLGLAIVARVAETHDGSVTVENRPGGGAVFTLRVRPVAGLTAAN